MKHFFTIILQIILFTLLTVITQIGGLMYIFSLIISKKWRIPVKFKTVGVFLGLYLMATLFLVPIVAPLFGREKIIHSEKIRPTNYMTVLLNRNYVVPELNKLLLQTATALADTPIEISYLDANFPFLNKFPLLPHLSHNDGKKIDLSLVYETPEGIIVNQKKSVSGYGAFVAPKPKEYNQVENCLSNGYFQYDYPKYLTLGSINATLVFSEKGTKQFIQTILKNETLGKLFIEPHLKTRMDLKHKKIRYHGCRAVRHDDHIHIQLK
ncbi:hypothetical protein [Cellulophaga sp. HaHa_2_1]|uniref:hypothetical protein n=1 Tax=Cellulophaga sp. HaHa_2_1 TaxID=2749994 RepID=UPI001C4FDED2|nr:hypothetical protein [Cellulophaga sp. HaHa_2_1]QXP52842.1 hypothetical protein H0I24_02645 [Cellulophaga sp. HaHa_2_1]